MNWNLEGLRVKGKYMGEFPVTGKVELSRVKYGGCVCHTVVLDKPITVYKAVRERVLLEHEHVEQVYSNLNEFI
jgi:hypothetical protein